MVLESWCHHQLEDRTMRKNKGKLRKILRKLMFLSRPTESKNQLTGLDMVFMYGILCFHPTHLLHYEKCQINMIIYSKFVICQVVRSGIVNVIQNPSFVTNLTMEPYCILLPLTLLCRTTWQIANSLILHRVIIQLIRRGHKCTKLLPINQTTSWYAHLSIALCSWLMGRIFTYALYFSISKI